MIKYNKEFKVPYYESDKHGELTAVSMLKYLGELSGIHNNFLVDAKLMESLNYGWMLNRWKVKIGKYPKVGETIKIETWISKMDKFYAYREFMIYDEDNLEIGKATAIWIFLDLNRRRPIRITSEYYNLNNIIEDKAFDDFYGFPHDMEINSNMDFYIRRSDIDYNNHVNNTKYLDWMIETIPEEIYDSYYLSEFEIQYKKEIKYPDVILAGSQEIENKNETVIYRHNIINKDSEEQNAVGLSKWMVK